MTATYVSVEDVAARLRTSFDSTTTPSDAQVVEWIEDAQDYIDELAGRTWQGLFTTTEFQDYNGGGVIVTKKPGLISVTTLEYTLDNGATWITIPSTSYDLYEDEDTIELRPDSVSNTYPAIPRGNKKIRLTYTYGSTSVPPRIRTLCEDMVVMDTIGSLVNSSANTQGGTVQVGPIKVEDPGMFSLNALSGLGDSVRQRLDSLSGSRIRTTVGRNFTI